MTDQELQDLISKRDETANKMIAALDSYNAATYKLSQEVKELDSKIKQEELDREMAKSKGHWVEEVKSFFKNKSWPKTTTQLWTVEIDGKKLCSAKGKYTWTSENRAFRGICDYIYYHNYKISNAAAEGKVDLGAVVEELIDSGYIKITRVV